MAEQKQEFKFPTETIDLPSEGRLYPKDSPLSSGKIELKYMTAKEEDILTSQNLIKKGLVIDKLLNSLIVTEGIKTDDLFIGDKNAVMVASRILAYGGEYNVEVADPNTGETFQHTFDLTECSFKELPDDVDYSKNEFELTLPVSKVGITFKLLTGKDETNIANGSDGITFTNGEVEVSANITVTLFSHFSFSMLTLKLGGTPFWVVLIILKILSSLSKDIFLYTINSVVCAFDNSS